MRPVEYLGHVEPIVCSLFHALLQADKKAEAEHRIIDPMLRYHYYQIERWSKPDEYDAERVNSAHVRAKEAREALLLIGTASSSAASAILQTAKQCIALAWPKADGLQKGRKVGSQSLASVIWHARNQALHFEEGLPKNKDTRACLTVLGREFGLDVAVLETSPRSLARDIVALLGWIDYQSFANDMVALLNEP